MKNKYLIKILAISITLATPILAAGLEQSGATLLSDILAEPIANFSAHTYVPTKEEIYEIESLQKDFAINSETHSEFLADHKTIGEEKKTKKKVIQNIMHQLEAAATSGKQALVEFIVNQELKNSQDRALRFAIRNDQQAMVEFLLNHPGQLKPSQAGINTALKDAAYLGKKNMVEFLLDWKGEPQPHKIAINWALRSAASNNKQAVVEFLLNRHDGESTIKQYVIINTYRDAIANNYLEIIHLLEPIVPLEERLNHASPSRGIAHEIHNYNNTQVIDREISSSSTYTSRPNRLINVVWRNVNRLLKDVNIINYATAKLIIEQAIEKFIPNEQQDLATQAALHHLGSDSNYEHKLSVAITFIQTFHEDKMEHWINGFILESIEAYKNSSNSTSCSKGILERIATGFRGINPELDKLFAQAEAPLLVRNWLKIWDLPNINDEIKQDLVKQLKAKGINCDSGAADAANAFREIANEELQKQGIADNTDSK
ncbi:MAG: hypothetical protein WCP46_09380, partial [Alphaproteobacteria bacterium]